MGQQRDEMVVRNGQIDRFAEIERYIGYMCVRAESWLARAQTMLFPMFSSLDRRAGRGSGSECAGCVQDESLESDELMSGALVRASW